MEAIAARDDVNLQVCYFAPFTPERIKQGWHDVTRRSYERHISSAQAIFEINDYRNAVHVVFGDGFPFMRELFPILNREKLKWMLWSEPLGFTVRNLLKFNPFLCSIALPLLFLHKRKYLQMLSQQSLGVLVQGTMSRRCYEKAGIPSEKIDHLFYCGKALQCTADLKAKFQLEGKHCFIYIGQLSYRKGTDLLIKAFSALANAENWNLVLIGRDYGNGSYQKLGAKLLNEGRVKFLPPAVPEELGNIVAMSDVCILPSRYDGWGIVLNEAASLGKALIGTEQCGAAHHVIQQNVNGFMVKAGSVPALKNAMQRFVDNPRLATTMGTHSQALFFSEFTPKKNAERLVEAIQRQEQKIS